MPYPALDLYPSTTVFPGTATVAPGLDGVSVVLNGFSLNVLDQFGVLWQTLIPLGGWDGSPSSSLTLTQKTRAAGAWTGPRNLTQRVITLGGMVTAPDADAAVAASERLAAAVMLDAAVLTVMRGSTVRSAIVYRQGEVGFEEMTDLIFGWSIDLVAPDPRKFAAAVSATTALPSGSGGFSVPFTVPFAINSNIVSGEVHLTNPGNATGAVVLRIDGPVVGPQITHVGTGLQLIFSSSLTLAAGEWLEVDTEAQTALANGQASRNNAITSRGWFGFESGPNTFAFAAVSGSGLLTVSGTPAWQ